MSSTPTIGRAVLVRVKHGDLVLTQPAVITWVHPNGAVDVSRLHSDLSHLTLFGSLAELQAVDEKDEGKDSPGVAVYWPASPAGPDWSAQIASLATQVAELRAQVAALTPAETPAPVKAAKAQA